MVWTEAAQVEGRQVCRWWSRKQVGNIPNVNSVVCLSQWASDFPGRAEQCLRLGLGSGVVTNLHLEINHLSRNLISLHGLCSLPFPQHRRLSFMSVLRAVLASLPHHPTVPHLSFSQTFNILLQMLLGHRGFSFSFWSLVEIHFSADSEVFISLAVVWLKESDTIVYVFDRTRTCVRTSSCNQQCSPSVKCLRLLLVCYLVVQFTLTRTCVTSSVSGQCVRGAPSLKSFVIKANGSTGTAE